MSNEPEHKKRKMDALVSRNSGDDYADVAPTTSVLVSKNLTSVSRAANASPSGDFGDPSIHQCVALIGSDPSQLGGGNSSDDHYDLYQNSCELGDKWSQNVQFPLSKSTQRPIRTGNNYYDIMVPDLEQLGYRPIHVIAKGKFGTLVLAQDLHRNQGYEECETEPVAIKLNSGKSIKPNRSDARTEMYEEMEIHRSLTHANIVRWLANIEHRGRLAIVMEFCGNGTLEDLLSHQVREIVKMLKFSMSYTQLFSYVQRYVLTTYNLTPNIPYQNQKHTLSSFFINVYRYALSQIYAMFRYNHFRCSNNI